MLLMPYIINYGDNFYKLARQFNTTIDAIISVNPTVDPNNIYIGQQLCIPIPQPPNTVIAYKATRPTLVNNENINIGLYPVLNYKPEDAQYPYIYVPIAEFKRVGADVEWDESQQILTVVSDYYKLKDNVNRLTKENKSLNSMIKYIEDISHVIVRDKDNMDLLSYDNLNMKDNKKNFDSYDFPPEEFYDNLYNYDPDKIEENLRLILNELENINKITDGFYEKSKKINQKLLDYENKYEKERTRSYEDSVNKAKAANNIANYFKDLEKETKSWSKWLPRIFTAVGVVITVATGVATAPLSVTSIALISAISVASHYGSTKINTIHVDTVRKRIKAEEKAKDAKSEKEAYQKEKLDGLTLDDIIKGYEPLKAENDELKNKNNILEGEKKQLQKEFQEWKQKVIEAYEKHKKNYMAECEKIKNLYDELLKECKDVEPEKEPEEPEETPEMKKEQVSQGNIVHIPSGHSYSSPYAFQFGIDFYMYNDGEIVGVPRPFHPNNCWEYINVYVNIDDYYLDEIQRIIVDYTFKWEGHNVCREKQWNSSEAHSFHMPGERKLNKNANIRFRDTTFHLTREKSR